MPARRSYGDSCGIARALDVVGERWSLLIVRELLLGPKRFADLRSGLPGVSANVLSQRLRELEAAGLVRRVSLPPPVGSRVYELTECGLELEPVLVALGRFGRDVPFPDGSGPLGTDAAVIALRTTFDPAAAAGLEADVELRLGPDRFIARVRDERLDVARDAGSAAGAGLHTDTGTLAGLLWHGQRLRQAERSGAATVTGDRSLVERFLTLFDGRPG